MGGEPTRRALPSDLLGATMCLRVLRESESNGTRALVPCADGVHGLVQHSPGKDVIRRHRGRTLHSCNVFPPCFPDSTPWCVWYGSSTDLNRRLKTDSERRGSGWHSEHLIFVESDLASRKQTRSFLYQPPARVVRSNLEGVLWSIVYTSLKTETHIQHVHPMNGILRRAHLSFS